jgi:hypothetical protein
MHLFKTDARKCQVMLGGAHITPTVKANQEFGDWRLAGSKDRIGNHHPAIPDQKPSRCSEEALGRCVVDMMENSACKDDIETLARVH